MESTTNLAGVTYLTQTKVVNGEIDFGLSPQRLRQRIMAGECFVAKSVFEKAFLLEMANEVVAGFADQEAKFAPFSWGMENFWRVDDNPPKSLVKKVQVFYYDFVWNRQFARMSDTARKIARARNVVGGLDVDYGFRKEDDYVGIPLLHHIPRGGGFIGEHCDALKPQGCVISLTVHKEFTKGGLFVVKDGRQVLVEPLLEAGDLFIFRPDINHGILPVDPDAEKDFASKDGRWRLSTILVPPAERAS